MCAKKLSESFHGRWLADDFGMPVLVLDPPAALKLSPLPGHSLGTGRIKGTVDALGRLTMTDAACGSMPLDPAVPSWFSSAFHVCLETSGEKRTILLSNISPEEAPRLEWGVCHAKFGGRIELASRPIEVTVAFTAPHDADYLLAEVDVANPGEGELPLTIRAAADHLAAPGDGGGLSSPFSRDHVVMFASAGENGSDFFLGAPSDWHVGAGAHSLFAWSEQAIPGGGTYHALFILGIRHDCAVEWARNQLSAASSGAARKEWAGILDLTYPRFPESWMREECVWDVSRLLAERRRGPVDLPRQEGCDQAIVRTLPGTFPDAESLRDLIRLSLPLSYINPELARNNLLGATVQLQKSGRLGAGSGEFRPERDSCDLEVWLLLAWCHLLQLTGDVGAVEHVADGAGGTVHLQSLLERAYTWVESAMGTGSHGLLRMGAGDGFPLLDQVGRHGCGESFTATAQFVYALDLWLMLEPQLTDRPTLPMERARLWVPNLRKALGEAFVNGVFIRAFDDTGSPVGANADGDGWYLDAQAWGLLTNCGSAAQRAAVLARLVAGAASHALPVVSKAYQLPFPKSLGSRSDLPGVAANGGIDTFAWACAVWAMSESGAKDSALQQWRKLSLRGRMAELNLPPFRPVESGGFLPSHLLRAEFAEVRNSSLLCHPGAAWLAWQHFALCKILTQE